MWAVIGLGNPGLAYRFSRHNIGFQVVDRLAEQYAIRWGKDKLINAWIARGQIGDDSIILAKPLTYMNRSGLAVKKLRDYYNIDLERILVVIDDIDLPWRKIRIRKQGSSGGHNGLKSIIAALETDCFPRLRLGVGRCSEDKQIVHHVLERFGKRERKQLLEFYQTAIAAIETIFDKDIEAAMNEFNNTLSTKGGGS